MESLETNVQKTIIGMPSTQNETNRLNLSNYLDILSFLYVGVILTSYAIFIKRGYSSSSKHP